MLIDYLIKTFESTYFHNNFKKGKKIIIIKMKYWARNNGFNCLVIVLLELRLHEY